MRVSVCLGTSPAVGSSWCGVLAAPKHAEQGVAERWGALGRAPEASALLEVVHVPCALRGS